MPRLKAYQPEALLDSALHQFWTHGFTATSIDDLVRACGVSRHGLYSEHQGKAALFLACFERYKKTVVDPAFEQVEAEGAGLEEIAAYFEAQIALAQASGLPGPGCFVGNAATEVAPHDAKVKGAVDAHNSRLSDGFRRALETAGVAENVAESAENLVIFAAELWAMSRLTEDAAALRRSVRTHLKLLMKDTK